ncbi:MAG: hypothetical protein RL591_297, partial [Planctomycetota bacterium]
MHLAAGITSALCVSIACAHPPDEFDPAASRVWTNVRTGESIEGSFIFARSGKIGISTRGGDLTTIALEDLASDARAYADERIATIRAINESRVELALASAFDASNTATVPTQAAAKPAQSAIFDAFAPFVKTRFDERWL